MTPLMKDGDYFLITKRANLRRYQMIYFKIPDSNERSIRRIIGMPGEEVAYKEDQLLIDKQEKNEPYLQDALNDANQNGFTLTEDFDIKKLTGQLRIPKDKYLVLGDNRQYSSDSRYYGLIDKKDIIGVVKMRVLPFHEMTKY